MIFLPK